jgi:hypothetical protein
MIRGIEPRAVEDFSRLHVGDNGGGLAAAHLFVRQINPEQ